MVEPPILGFTGVVWPARPTEQLARDLTTGPGARPMTDAATAWAQLATALGSAVVEYDRIVSELRESWRSDGSDLVLERVSTLRDWFAQAAEAAGRNAAGAGGQAAAYEIARLAMPHVAEIAALQAVQQSIEQAGTALGAPLVAAAAQVDTEQDLAKADAARVMQTYESATTPLATPWPQEHPPVIATAVALQAEQNAARPTSAVAPAMPPGGLSPVLPGAPGPLAVPLTQTAYRAQSVVQAAAAVETSAAQPVPVHAEETSGRMVPGMAPGSAGAADAERAVRAGATTAARPGEDLQMEAGIDAAPPVLGGVAEQNAPAPGVPQS